MQLRIAFVFVSLAAGCGGASSTGMLDLGGVQTTSSYTDASTSDSAQPPSADAAQPKSDAPNGPTTIVSAMSGARCLDDYADNTTAGNKVQIYTCNGSAAQTWTYTNSQLTGPGGLCLSVASEADGTPVLLGDCTSGEKWTFVGKNIESSSGLCLAVQDADDADSTAVQISTCKSGDTSQEWNWTTTSSTPDGGTGTTPPNTSGLLAYLQSLNQGTSKRVLTGQHANYWQQDNSDQYGEQLDEFVGSSAQTATITTTGKTPAVLGTTFDMEYQNVTKAQNLKLANDWLAAGGLLQISWWAENPAGDGNNPFPDVLDSTTTTGKAWTALLDSVAAQLAEVNGTVMFRPFLEQNGNWFWWGTENRSNAQFIQLWQSTHDYLVKTKGLKNLLFVYAVNADTGGASAYNGMYAGTDYVDIVGFDYYGNNPAGDCLSTYQTLQTMKKPIIIAEAGTGNATNTQATDAGDNGQWLSAVKSSMPDIVAVMVWSQSWALSNQNGAATFLDDSWAIDRDALPNNL